jgi:hypothetical protein
MAELTAWRQNRPRRQWTALEYIYSRDTEVAARQAKA